MAIPPSDLGEVGPCSYATNLRGMGPCSFAKQVTVVLVLIYIYPPEGLVKRKLKPHTSTYQIHVVFQFTPTLPLQQQLALLLPGP